MGDATIEGSKWRLVEVGRVVLLQGNSPYAGRLATIVEIIDHKRLAVPRQPISLANALLSSLKVEGLPRGARTGTVKKFWEKSEIDAKWKETNWFKRSTQIERRKNLTDFDRFKVLRLKKQRRFEQRKELAKVKAAA
ncbi:ribosomal protein L14 [Colletotrichum tofieldiae]|nr:ribosomal protein L14 [Colletotrichum tofieldiae]